MSGFESPDFKEMVMSFFTSSSHREPQVLNLDLCNRAHNIRKFNKTQRLLRKRMAVDIRLIVLLRATGFCWMESVCAKSK